MRWGPFIDMFHNSPDFTILTCLEGFPDCDPTFSTAFTTSMPELNDKIVKINESHNSIKASVIIFSFARMYVVPNRDWIVEYKKMCTPIQL